MRPCLDYKNPQEPCWKQVQPTRWQLKRGLKQTLHKDLHNLQVTSKEIGLEEREKLTGKTKSRQKNVAINWNGTERGKKTKASNLWRKVLTMNVPKYGKNQTDYYLIQRSQKEKILSSRKTRIWPNQWDKQKRETSHSKQVLELFKRESKDNDKLRSPGDKTIYCCHKSRTQPEFKPWRQTVRNLKTEGFSLDLKNQRKLGTNWNSIFPKYENCLQPKHETCQKSIKGTSRGKEPDP